MCGVILCIFWLHVWLAEQWRHLTGRKQCLRPQLPTPGVRPAPARRSGGKRKPRSALDQVLALHFAGLSIRQIKLEYDRLSASIGETISIGTVHKWLQLFASDMRAVQLATKHVVPKHMPANRCWGVEATGKKDATSKLHTVLGIIDCGTRLCIALKSMADESSAAFLQEVRTAIALFGKPKWIRTDNGSVFRSREFRNGPKALGIRKRFSAPGKPWQNGRIERLFLTLKQELNRLIPMTGNDLDMLLDQFRYWYNEVRPHQHLFGWTPMEAWRGANPYAAALKATILYQSWGGLLLGFIQRR